LPRVWFLVKIVPLSLTCSPLDILGRSTPAAGVAKKAGKSKVNPHGHGQAWEQKLLKYLMQLRIEKDLLWRLGPEGDYAAPITHIMYMSAIDPDGGRCEGRTRDAVCGILNKMLRPGSSTFKLLSSGQQSLIRCPPSPCL